MGEKNFLDLAVKAKNLFLYDVAIKYLEQAVELKNSEAMYLLGDIYYEGNIYIEKLLKPEEIVPTTDYAKAFDFYKKSADDGYSPAFNMLGLMYFLGIGTEVNITESKKYFQRAIDSEKIASEKGDAFAIESLGNIYENYRAVCAFNGDNDEAENFQELSVMSYEGAFHLLKEMAFSENVTQSDSDKAILHIADLYRFGNGVAMSDKDSVLFLVMLSNVCEDDETKILAYKKIAAIYEMSKDYEKQVEYLEQSAALGDFISMRKLWKIYELGEVVEKKLSESQKWLKKSEELQKKFLEEIRL